MGKVIASITKSVDGYVTGPGDGPEAGLGRGGERLHYCGRGAMSLSVAAPTSSGRRWRRGRSTNWSSRRLR